MIDRFDASDDRSFLEEKYHLFLSQMYRYGKISADYVIVGYSSVNDVKKRDDGIFI